MADYYYSPFDGYCPTTPNGDCPCPDEGAEALTTDADPDCQNQNTGTDGGGNCQSSPSSVLISTGGFMLNIPLMSISSIGGIQWSFRLRYLATSGVSDLVGKGFNYPQNLRLVELGNGDVELHTGSNTKNLFVKTGTSTYEAGPKNTTRAELTRSGSGASDEFLLTSSKNVRTKFYGFDAAISTKGRVKSIVDRYGNAATYSWVNTGGVDQLQSVTDSYGRTVSYRYYGSEAGYRLREIEDFLGRKLNFQYDSAGRLTAAVAPSILKAAAGNTFPGGKAYVFQYDVNNSRPERRDDLIRVWFPNQATPFIDADTRTVDVAKVYADAKPRYFVEYGQDPTDDDMYGRVIRETVGDPDSGVGGTYSYLYTSNPSELPTNLIDAADPIVFRTVVTDRNGNQRLYDFTASKMVARQELIATRMKNSLQATSFIVWTKFNQYNQPLVRVRPEGDSVEYTYEDGTVSGISGKFNRRVGLLLLETHKPGNSIGIPSRAGSNGQTELTRRFFYDPVYNRRCAVIERRGNPVAAGSTYFTPQNGGTTPTNSDRSRYVTITYFDYQKNQTATITGNAALQAQLGLNATQIQALIDHVNGQMTSGGLPAGFERNLGDINGDGTGDGAGSGLTAAKMIGNAVKIKRPSVRLIGSASITTQVREELYTSNDRGQVTTYTDAEGNVTITIRYPESDPEGDGQFVASTLSNKQYGRTKEVHVDADPNDVMSLVGVDGDLVDFKTTVAPRSSRTNTPGIYQDLVTRYEGAPGSGGCTACAYDPLGNPLTVTDPRGFTTHFERNEMGKVFRTTSPPPYEYKAETHYDANGNITRVDTEDRQVRYASDDPGSADYGRFTPSGSGSIAHVPTLAGSGGAVRAGWFTNLYTYDILDQKIEDDIDATGSNPSSLVTTYQYDPNQNLIKVTKSQGNTAEYDYDERDLRIAQRVGFVSGTSTGAVTIWAYDKNGNLVKALGPAQLGGAGNQATAIIDDAFRSGASLTHTGTFDLENTYDGFNRVTSAKDAAGNVVDNLHDPDSRVIQSTRRGPVGGATPTDRNGSTNVDMARAIPRYDEAGRAYESQQDVFLASGTTLPSGRAVTHTGGGLETNSTANGHTGTVTLTSGGSSYVLTRTVYDRTGRVAESLQDNATKVTYAYDGANRVLSVTDPLNNKVENTYDNNGNVIAIKRTDKCTITVPTVTDEVFQSAMRYDALNRLVVSAAQGADGTLSSDLSDAQTLFTLVGYDSRGNVTVTVDPKKNSAITVYDGASRSVQTVQLLRQNGQGTAPGLDGQSFLPSSDATIVTTTVYDGNGRVIELIDDRGGVTRYEYDTLDRQTKMIFHDGSTRSSVYNVASDVDQYTDENGSIFFYTYDALHRRTLCSISRANLVVGTTAQSFEYDGLSRQTFARDTVVAANADVKLRYDSVSRVLEDSQVFGGNTRNVTHSKFASHPASEFTFPQGRQLTNTYDALYRRTDVSETGGSSVAAWQFFGPGRVAEVKYGYTSGGGIHLYCTFMNNARTRSAVQAGLASPGWGDQSSDRLGYDGAGRMITKRYLITALDGNNGYASTFSMGYTTAYDLASNKLYERHLFPESRSHLYEPFTQVGSKYVPQGGYDSIDRLRQYQRGTLSSTIGQNGQGGGSVTAAITLPNANESQTYDLDGLGNWRRTTIDPVGGAASTQIRQHNYLNQITKLSATAFDYDHGNNVFSGDPAVKARGNGNLVNDGTRKYEYDALNRLVNVYKTPGSPVLVANYIYDVFGRRIRKVVTNGGLSGSIPNGTTDCLYSGWRCIEERDGSNNPTKQYVWGIYLDELIQQKSIVALNNFAANTELYPMQDLLYRTIGLIDNGSVIREAYDTDAYGNTLIFRNAGSPPASINFNDADTQVKYPTCDFIFTGQRYDPETEIYCYRRRFYAPSLGIFVSRDLHPAINFYTYVRNRPVAMLDPYGESELAASDYLTYLRGLIDGGTTDFDELFKKSLDYYLENDPEDDFCWDCEDDMEELFDAWDDLFGTSLDNLSAQDQARAKAVRDASAFGSTNWDLVNHFFAGAGISAEIGANVATVAGWLVEAGDEVKAITMEAAGTRKSWQAGADPDDFRFTHEGAEFADMFDTSEADCRKLVKTFTSGSATLSSYFPAIPKTRKVFRPAGLTQPHPFTYPTSPY